MNDVHRIRGFAQVAEGVTWLVQVSVTKAEYPKDPAIRFNGHEVPRCFGRKNNVSDTIQNGCQTDIEPSPFQNCLPKRFTTVHCKETEKEGKKSIKKAMPSLGV